MRIEEPDVDVADGDTGFDDTGFDDTAFDDTGVYDDDRLRELPLEADPADVADQDAVVPFDDDDR